MVVVVVVQVQMIVVFSTLVLAMHMQRLHIISIIQIRH
jgi:hypothetical protein